MKNFGKIRLTQSRIATGKNQDARTKLYIFEHFDKGVYFDDKKRYDPREGFNLIGFFSIIHPSILAGTWEDFVSDAASAARRKLLKNNLAEENECGFLFLK